MLRITVQDSPAALTFLVEGKLVGAWAKELEQSWREAAPVRGNRALIVDLTEALFIDGEGRRILAKLFREGAPARALKLMDSRTTSTGVIIARYQPDGPVRLSPWPYLTFPAPRVTQRKHDLNSITVVNSSQTRTRATMLALTSH